MPEYDDIVTLDFLEGVHIIHMLEGEEVIMWSSNNHVELPLIFVTVIHYQTIHSQNAEIKNKLKSLLSLFHF